MATANGITQVKSIGTHQRIPEEKLQAAIVLLRAIREFPILDEGIADRMKRGPNFEDLVDIVDFLRSNCHEFAKVAAEVLCDTH